MKNDYQGFFLKKYYLTTKSFLSFLKSCIHKQNDSSLVFSEVLPLLTGPHNAVVFLPVVDELEGHLEDAAALLRLLQEGLWQHAVHAHHALEVGNAALDKGVAVENTFLRFMNE